MEKDLLQTGLAIEIPPPFKIAFSVTKDPIFVVHDIGATFGNKGFLGQNPRGDYSAFLHPSLRKLI